MILALRDDAGKEAAIDVIRDADGLDPVSGDENLAKLNPSVLLFSQS
jgi:hypothetical protein